MANWHWMKGEQRNGPINTTALKKLAQAGQLLPTDMIWRDGLPQWVPASSVKGLFVGPPPPPPPPPPSSSGVASDAELIPISDPLLSESRRRIYDLRHLLRTKVGAVGAAVVCLAVIGVLAWAILLRATSSADKLLGIWYHESISSPTNAPDTSHTFKGTTEYVKDGSFNGQGAYIWKFKHRPQYPPGLESPFGDGSIPVEITYTYTASGTWKLEKNALQERLTDLNTTPIKLVVGTGKLSVTNDLTNSEKRATHAQMLFNWKDFPDLAQAILEASNKAGPKRFEVAFASDKEAHLTPIAPSGREPSFTIYRKEAHYDPR